MNQILIKAPTTTLSQSFCKVNNSLRSCVRLNPLIVEGARGSSSRYQVEPGNEETRN
ncbi:hypothetical protein [Chlorogloeopsis fritschii]|uniref:hypothetical protein n=1 Tax=Chlorogloeopsis fritschii TaxID=1124 RepID=UPI0023F1A076|nr:hypothetical protein [Chlorogloeopsis fritschii]